jgi:hypothetical protein
MTKAIIIFIGQTWLKIHHDTQIPTELLDNVDSILDSVSVVGEARTRDSHEYRNVSLN